MNDIDYDTLTHKIHNSLLEIKDLRWSLNQISITLDDIRDKIDPVEKGLRQKLEQMEEER